MTRYLLNSPIVAIPPEDREAIIYVKKLTLEEAREWAKGDFISAIGHESTALMLTSLLGVDVPVNRIRISLKEGDEALVTQFLVRPPEGKIWSLRELEQLWREGKIQFLLLVRLPMGHSSPN